MWTAETDGGGWESVEARVITRKDTQSRLRDSQPHFSSVPVWSSVSLSSFWISDHCSQPFEDRYAARQ